MAAAVTFRESLTPAELREQFEALAADWEKQSGHLSNTRQMAMLRPYQRIIGLGRPVVPLILEEMQQRPGHWFWALEAITGENPYTPETNAGFTLIDVPKATEAWLEWGRRNQLI